MLIAPMQAMDLQPTALLSHRLVHMKKQLGHVLFSVKVVSNIPFCFETYLVKELDLDMEVLDHYLKKV